MPDHGQQGGARNDEPRKDGCNRGPGQFKIQRENEDRVQRRIGKAPINRGHHGALRIAVAAQDCPADHPHHQQRQGRHHDQQILHRLIRRAALCAQQVDQCAQVQAHEDHENHPEQHPPDHRVGGFGPRLIRVAPPDRPRHQR